MLTRLLEQDSRRAGRRVLAVLGVMLALAVAGTVLRIVQSVDAQRREIVLQGSFLAQSLEHELEVHLYNVKAMNYMAQRYLEGRIRLARDPVSLLVPEADGQGYHSYLPGEDATAATRGRISGLGAAPGAGSPQALEMTMAVGLTPVMQAIRERSPYIPWVYYTSASGFIYLFPESEARGSRFSADLLGYEFMAGARPQANPRRQPFWSKPYEDDAGKGRMLTVSHPIYQGDVFKGSVSIDVGLRSLQEVLDRHALPHVRTILRTRDGEALAEVAVGGAPVAGQGTAVASLPLKSAPWEIELRADASGLWLEAIAGRAAHIAAVLFLAGAMVFIHLLLQSGRRLNRLKGEFISTVSHELRTPLTSIHGSLGLLTGGAGGTLPAPVATLVEIAHRNSGRLILLVNDLLDIEKLEAGKLKFQLQPQPLMPLLRQSLEAHRGYADRFQVRFELQGDLGDACVNVDGMRLMQVMANLLSNAAKFSPPGSAVQVVASREGSSLRVGVRNPGPGIPPEFRSRIFGKFAQADASDTRSKGGTGLGLAVCKALIERQGGQIGFESEPGVTTEFFFTLPETGPTP